MASASGTLPKLACMLSSMWCTLAVAGMIQVTAGCPRIARIPSACCAPPPCASISRVMVRAEEATARAEEATAPAEGATAPAGREVQR